MKKFIKKSVLLLLITVILFSCLIAFNKFVIGPQYNSSYQASLIDKVDRLTSINEPKIILVGHSNLSFGMNSEMLEEEIGMPVVNLGLHGALGNAFHEEIARLNINEGDIVIVCHDSFYDNDELESPSLAWTVYDWNDSLWPIIREKDYIAMLRAYPDYLKSAFLLWINGEGNKSIDSSYQRAAFNEYGDVVYRPEYDQIDADDFFSKNQTYLPGINDTCINRLNDLNSYCNERGATMLVAGYPVAYGKYSTYTEEDFVIFQNMLSERLDCTVISDYTDYFYPYEYFYNTIMHLTEEGANVRTMQLIDDLKAWMADK